MIELTQEFFDAMKFANQRELRTYYSEHHKEMNCNRPLLLAAYAEWKNNGGLEDNELLLENIKFKQQVQKYADSNRIERAAFRSHARISNALEEFTAQLVDMLGSLDIQTVQHPAVRESPAVGVIQLSDLHLNELIDIKGNKYDFNIASKRLRLLAERSIRYFRANDINNIVIAITGDCLNSDRRLDEMLNQCTNRAKATLLAFHLLEQFIMHLNEIFNVNIISVSGNESRAKDEMGFSEILASDNYDFTLFNLLKIAFRNKEGITFVDGRAMEEVINIAGQNVLLMHGIAVKRDIEKSIQQTMGRYSAHGIHIDYMFIGHIHSARIGDLYARSSSLCGSNGYSDYALNLAGRASQNIGIFYSDKSHDVMKIDLQNVDHIEGYNINIELEAYNAKSSDKLFDKKVIFQVIV
jgi:predicted phosphodiesterase